jgi:hypothetical protein
VSGHNDDDANSENSKVLDSLPGEEDRGEDSAAGGGARGGKSAWATQADQSHREKDRREEDGGGNTDGEEQQHEWRTCNVKAGADYIPCLDNEKAVKKLRPENFRRYEHRERHCPDEGPTCLAALPRGYRRPVEWPTSRDRVSTP